jgi:hypothetical protein
MFRVRVGQLREYKFEPITRIPPECVSDDAIRLFRLLLNWIYKRPNIEVFEGVSELLELNTVLANLKAFLKEWKANSDSHCLVLQGSYNHNAIRALAGPKVSVVDSTMRFKIANQRRA